MPTHVKRTTTALLQKGFAGRRAAGRNRSNRFSARPLAPAVHRRSRCESWPSSGIKRVFVAMPGFTADCLETIDEIGFEVREMFLHAGGDS